MASTATASDKKGIEESIKATERPYRRPAQARGKEKFQRILDAAHRLIEQRILDTTDSKDISLYDVADEAGVATGSVYHFFPSMEAVLAALVEYYDEKFAETIRQPIDRGQITSWKDVLITHTENSRAFINSHRPALWLIIGPGRTWQTRQLDTIGDTRIAQAMIASYREFFVLPSSPKPEEVLHYCIRMLEGFWELSYQLHGYVTDEMSEETNKAMIAYLSLYWPSFLEQVEP